MAQLLEFKGLLSFLILHELQQEPLYGEQLAERIGARKGTMLTPGTIYPALKRLHKQKLITRKRDGRLKIYSLTKQGESELKAFYKVFGKYFQGLREKIPESKKKKTSKKQKKMPVIEPTNMQSKKNKK